MGNGPVLAQIPVLSFVIYHGEERIVPQDPNYEVWLTPQFGAAEKDAVEGNLLSTYDPDSFYYPYAFAHQIPDPEAHYELNICHEMDTMTVQIKTWFVDWYNVNLLLSYVPGCYCFDMKDAVGKKAGIAPVGMGKFLKEQFGDCFPP